MVNRNALVSWLMAIFFGLCSQLAMAELTIEITQGMEGAAPIAVVPFGWQGSQPLPQDVSGIVAADLRRSGRFDPLPEADLIARPHEGKQVRFGDWRVLGVPNLVVGQIRSTGPDQYTVQFQLFDIYRGQQLIGYSIPARGSQLRRVAHQISDLIYEKLTGEPGAFATRIAYVMVQGSGDAKRFALQIADSDGYDPQTVLRSQEPIMSPAWSPDGNRVAYVSFEQKKAAIYVQDIATGKRRQISSHQGVNGAPAWSPDGRKLALTLSRDGNPEVYVLDVQSSRLTRLTFSAGIDTEAAWSPDGKSLVFTSDRGGAPQLYRVSASGGKAKRITFEGSYNAGGDFSPDGKRLTLVHRVDGNYRIAVLELGNGLLRVLSEGSLDESPSFAPNGRMIIYATDAGNRGILAAVSADGRFRQRLQLKEGDVREPAWSPALTR